MLIKGNVKWHQEAEVVIAGYGGAGGIAAFTAKDLGTDVLLLEKQKAGNHYTNTGMAGALFLSPNDAGKAAMYLKGLRQINENLTSEDNKLIDTWAAYVSENKQWVEKTLGGVTQAYTVDVLPRFYPNFPGRESMVSFRFRGLGWGLMRAIEKKVSERNIPIIYGATANRLLTNLDGRVVGVRVEIEEDGQRKMVNIAASKAVVLTCGGFQYNEVMKRQYLPLYPFYGHGTPACTGEGVTMAQDIGAQLWHMNSFTGRLMAKFDEFPIAFSVELRGTKRPVKEQLGMADPGGQVAGFIIVDRHGKRFTSENVSAHALGYELAAWDSHRMEYTRIPSYMIFDQRRIESGAMVDRRNGAAGPYRLYEWSEDNHKEMEKGWIIQADTIPELARKIHMDPDVLAKTVATYNGYCAQGVDPEFGASPAGLVPLQNPPYFAFKLWPGGACAHGGPKRNGKGQVLNMDGEPIPGLYVAGELGSIYGMHSINGGFIAEVLSFGRIAGENVAKEKSVSIK